MHMQLDSGEDAEMRYTARVEKLGLKRGWSLDISSSYHCEAHSNKAVQAGSMGNESTHFEGVKLPLETHFMCITQLYGECALLLMINTAKHNNKLLASPFPTQPTAHSLISIPLKS
jgi:hypothetical protein